MSVFRVGQRVRSLPTRLRGWTDEGTITTVDADHLFNNGELQVGYLVQCDNHRSMNHNGGYWHRAHQLAPLTDPKADEFIERIKKLGNEPVTTRDKVNA